MTRARKPAPRRSPADPGALAAGVAHFNAGRLEEALAAFRAAGDPVMAAHAEEALGRRGRAVELLAAALKDGRPGAAEGLAGLVLRLAPARDAAADALRAVFSVRPEAATLEAAGRAFRAAGDLDSAEKAFALALERRGGSAKKLAEVRRRRADAALSAGELEKAESSLRSALKADASDNVARAGLARLLRRRADAAVTAGKLEKAEASLREALRVGRGASGARRHLDEVLRLRLQEKEGRAKEAAALKGERLRAVLEEMKAASQDRPAARLRRTKTLLARARAVDPADPRPLLLAGAILRSPALLRQGLKLGDGKDFAALILLGRYKDAVKAAGAKPSLAELRSWWDPWEAGGYSPAERRRLVDRLSKALGPRSPWTAYYRADLRGDDEAKALAALAALPPRWGWMLSKAGLSALCAGRFEEAETRLRAALRHPARDWRTRGFLAEAFLCRGKTQEAYAQMDLAAKEAPKDEACQVLAWRGAFDLWLGRYADAERRLGEALAQGAPYAKAWRAAALLQLGRAEEAHAELNEALKAFPGDLEAYVWRAEARRRLGHHAAALDDLAQPGLAGDGRSTPVWLWALVNRALAKHALGDAKGFESDYKALPAAFLAHVESRTDSTDPVALLENSLVLARGFRREEYAQALWMI